MELKSITAIMEQHKDNKIVQLSSIQVLTNLIETTPQTQTVVVHSLVPYYVIRAARNFTQDREVENTAFTFFKKLGIVTNPSTFTSFVHAIVTTPPCTNPHPHHSQLSVTINVFSFMLQKYIEQLQQSLHTQKLLLLSLSSLNEEKSRCALCLNQATHAAIPCGHMFICKDCSWPSNIQKLCPFCRILFTDTLRVYT